jgi:hypothetical protein
MLELRKITLQDKNWMQPILNKSNFRSEEYNFTFAYLWKDILSFRFKEIDGFIVQKSCNNRPAYLYPAGSGNVKLVIEAMIQDSEERGHEFLFYTILSEQCKLLEVLFPEKFDFWPIPKYDDYIYETQSLITLSGKKLHAKRNHINKFKSLYPDWAYEPITPGNMHEIIAMSAEWTRVHAADESKSLRDESKAMDAALKDFFSLGLDGGLIRAQGKVVAFSMGDRLTKDTYLVHIEKAFSDVPGAYAIINQQFAQHNCADYTYINREDDSGDEGLRKAKLSYRPIMRTEKYAARLRGEP